MQTDGQDATSNHPHPLLLDNQVLAGIRYLSLAVMLALALLAWKTSADSKSIGRTESTVETAGLTIDINTADRREWELMPGIGPTTAGHILEDRRANGPFESLGDLARVRGVGPKTIDEIAPYCRPVNR